MSFALGRRCWLGPCDLLGRASTPSVNVSVERKVLVLGICNASGEIEKAILCGPALQRDEFRANVYDWTVGSTGAMCVKGEG